MHKLLKDYKIHETFPRGARYVTACTDDWLIAQANEFVGTSSKAADNTYSVVNGETMV